MSGAIEWARSWWVTTVPTPEESPAEKLGKRIKEDITDYIKNGKERVLAKPVRALVYSVAIKMLSLFVALVFPFIGYATIGASIMAIDVQIVLNAKDFTDQLIISIKDHLKAMRDAIWTDG